jgi:hypothetical protein
MTAVLFEVALSGARVGCVVQVRAAVELGDPLLTIMLALLSTTECVVPDIIM